MIVPILLILVALAVLASAVMLHRTLRSSKSPVLRGCPASRTDMFRAVHGAIFLSAAYIMAEIRWLCMGLDSTIPALDDLLWSGIELGFLVYLLWCCLTVRKIVRRETGGCNLRAKHGGKCECYPK